MRIELPGGHYAEVREVTDIRNKDRKAVNQAIRVTVTDDDERILSASMADDMMDALLRRVITFWTFPIAIPIGQEGKDSLDQLTIEQYDALAEGVAEHMRVVRGDKAPVEDNPDPTPDSTS